ncbi:alkanesulfonate monooxygenase SsuD/methylene tetrahydromethanopterin reductase-like flavin-dependent oxidoreductase (luciferase family) [Kibdelosporangium banguiense]|uniref:Alkanesulfonate monooxygenase SsuD/methylene tetrahydromethanopterin reductase-like flavin-dependent oxidoreductase (Luciferase family) n=1 Tax=Kibdelosporangium banguiense TaxID=1365924 RepID=A0ABS4TRA7_9PSEU|nr:LLM class flavin-dependent oxidoreductase [Kibdelosporangium banguiense]MBP2326411.1 alkanesulfonate monooxygenase SsuD/methylene tetrahydromethanopterin reductase-like flavin-dependent oxidoreductase (luciferase family) [Kibdelosporangium banguiense]
MLPEHSGAETRRIWRHVEEIGADHAWTYDHLSWRSLRDEPWFDASTTLAAAAASTDRLRLGTLVATPNFRHPVTTAKQAMTLDHLSGGRFVLGLGAGATGADSTALGGQQLTPAARADRFEEFVALLDVLLRQPETTAHGRFYHAVDVRMVPGCVQRPRIPFAIAAFGKRGMRLAAAYAETWVTIGHPGAPGDQPEATALRVLRDQLSKLEAACHDRGRDFGDLRKLVNVSRVVADPYSSAGRFADVTGQCAELGFTDVVVGYPRRAGVFAGDPDKFERALAQATATTYQEAI